MLALDRAGLPLAPPARLAAPRSDRAVKLDLATSHGDVLLVWTEAADRSGAVGVRAQALSPTRRVRIKVVNVGDFGHDAAAPTYPQTIATPDGAVLVYFAQRDPAPAPMELYATPLRCAPR